MWTACESGFHKTMFTKAFGYPSFSALTFVAHDDCLLTYFTNFQSEAVKMYYRINL